MKAASSSPNAPKKPRKSASMPWRAITITNLPQPPFQIGIVLASAQVITGMVILGWLSGLLGVVGLIFTGIGLWAPHLVHLLVH